MRSARLAGAVVVAVFALGACLPASVRASGLLQPAETPAPRVDLCGQLAQVYAERDALGDVLRLVIDNKVDLAIPAVGSVRERLDRLLTNLPEERELVEPMTTVRGVVVAFAHLTKAVADVIDDPRRPTPDRQLILVEAETLVGMIDATFSPREPGDIVERTCPGVAYAPGPVIFPARPSVAELGLPARAGHLFLDSAHLGTLDVRTSQIIERLGGDPDRGREVEVDVTFGEGEHVDLRVYEGVSVDLRGFASAEATDLLAANLKPVERRTAGDRVISYADRDDPSSSLRFALRGDRILMMSGFSDADAESLLAAMP
ncbi:MAG: hypothetical protein ACJ77E_20190 [Gaiellaceae bacterium]